jgi:hypothetical protein
MSLSGFYSSNHAKIPDIILRSVAMTAFRLGLHSSEIALLLADRQPTLPPLTHLVLTGSNREPLESCPCGISFLSGHRPQECKQVIKLPIRCGYVR